VDSPFSLDAFANSLAWVAALLFALALVTAVVRHRRRERAPADLVDHLPGLIGLAALLTHIVLRAIQLGRAPVANLSEASVFLALLLAFAYLLAIVKFRFPAVEVALLLLILCFLGLSFVVPPDPGGVSASVTSRWFVFHVVVASLGLTALFAACIVSVLYLTTERSLKRKRPGRVLQNAPSLVACDRTAHRVLIFGFPLLTIAILTGGLWARETIEFSIGPKEMWAVVAWTVYAALLLARLVGGVTGRKAAILAIAGAAAALVAFLGIRL